MVTRTPTPDPGRGPAELPDRIAIRDATRMRAVAHPARLTILSYLAAHGPATATECARVCGLSPSATSYHLRALAKAGMIEEAPSRGDGRERLWQSLAKSWQVDQETFESVDDPELNAAGLALIDSVLVWQDARTRDYVARMDEGPEEWRRKAYISETTMLVTPEELEGLGRQVDGLLRSYNPIERKDAPPGARRVTAILRAFPSADPLTGEDVKE